MNTITIYRDALDVCSESRRQAIDELAKLQLRMRENRTRDDQDGVGATLAGCYRSQAVLLGLQALANDRQVGVVVRDRAREQLRQLRVGRADGVTLEQLGSRLRVAFTGHPSDLARAIGFQVLAEVR